MKKTGIVAVFLGLSLLGPGCTAEQTIPSAVSETAGEHWSKVVCDAGGGTVVVENSTISYSSFLIIEGSKIIRIGTFHEPRVQTEKQDGRTIVKITHWAGHGTGVLHLYTAVIVLREDVDGVTRYANFPAGGEKDAGWDGDEWGRRKLEARMTRTALADDALRVEYDLLDQGKKVRHLQQVYPLSKDPRAWTDCPPVTEYLAIPTSSCHKIPGTTLIGK